MRKCIAPALAGLFGGFAFGFLGVWLGHYGAGLAENKDHWWELPMLPSLPGFFTVPLWDPTWDGGDVWAYRFQIAESNAIFWMLVSPLLWFLMSDLTKFVFNRRRIGR
jgi:hypothetical protein